jgi:hypothetical protein
MKIRLVLIILLCGLLTLSYGQQGNKWEKLKWLVGDWVGEGSGQPGQGGGTFSFHFGLNNNVLERKSHSEYPATGDRPAVIHDDLMIIYPDNSGNAVKAIYFDNEGHVINYNITFQGNTVVLTSEKMTGSPVFRLVYTLLDPETSNTRFEISQDGEKFTPYVEGKSKRIK